MEPFKVMTAKELCTIPLRQLREESRPVWRDEKLARFQKSNLTIQVDDGKYEIDLENCNSSAQALDWIFQIFTKSWCSPLLIANVLYAFEDAVFECFDENCVQGVFCPGAIGSTPETVGNLVCWPFGKKTKPEITFDRTFANGAAVRASRED